MPMNPTPYSINRASAMPGCDRRTRPYPHVWHGAKPEVALIYLNLQAVSTWRSPFGSFKRGSVSARA
jgi:hypothetical protein